MDYMKPINQRIRANIQFTISQAGQFFVWVLPSLYIDQGEVKKTSFETFSPFRVFEYLSLTNEKSLSNCN